MADGEMSGIWLRLAAGIFGATKFA